MTKFGLIRVSTDEQANQGLSIEAQRQKLIENGVQEKDIITLPGISGGIKKITIKITDTSLVTEYNLQDKKELLKLLQKIELGDELYFLKYDRLGRNFSFIESIYEYSKHRGFTLNPINESREEIVRQIVSVLGQWERQQTTKRVNDIVKAQYEQGLYPYRAPIGYKKKEGGILIPNKKAGMIREIYQETIEKQGYAEICLRHGINPQTYYNIIKNPVYAGITHLNHQEYKKGKHEPLITFEQYKTLNPDFSLT